MNTNKKNNIILNSLSEAKHVVETASVIPPGYIEVALSTKGKVGAPSIIHVRNFKVKEIVALAMSSDSELSVRVINALNEMIFEDVDVSQWHEKEVEELLVHIFMTFYKGVIDDMPYRFTEEELKKMEQTPAGVEQVKAIREGKYVPKTSINIGQDVDTYDLSDNFNPNITITNKNTGFHITFGFIKYGDQIIIKKWLDSYFSKEDVRFAKIKKQIEYNNGLANQFKDNPENIDKIIKIDKNEEDAYKEYIINKTQAITEIARLISIIDYNGQDVSNLSASEKYELMSEDARIDYNLISKLVKRQEKLQFGIKPEVQMKNPITGEVVKRPLSFRVSTLIQTMQLSGNDEYDDGYDDED